MVLQSPWTTGVIAAVFVGLALSMFGLFELRMPTAWTTRVANRTGRLGGTTGSAALLGFSSALIVGPCVTVPLAGALLYIAQTGDVALGASALFALAVGKGLPLIALGTLGGRAPPRAGSWMESVKRGFGLLFLATAIWVATPLLPPGTDLALWAILLLGLAGAAFSATLPRGLALAAGRTAGAAGRPTLVYFTADWCISCRVIERGVLQDPGVRQALSGFQLVKADLTDVDAGIASLTNQLRVAGPPTMLFFEESRGAACPLRIGWVRGGRRSPQRKLGSTRPSQSAAVPPYWMPAFAGMTGMGPLDRMAL